MQELIKPSLARKIALRLQLDAKLPSIKADRGQLEQLIMNLVLNASEAIGHQSGQVTIETGVQTLTERDIANQRNFVGADLRPGQYVYVQVSDTGCGMDEATQARVFDPFFSTKFTGRGLGLSAVSGILRGHKGAARISSTPGGGTCFRAMLPAMASESPASGPVAGTAATDEPGKILIVDDEEMVRTMAKLSLERSGFNVLTADSGRTAIDLVERHCREIQLVVLDISMPGMSGEEVLHELCKIRPDIRVVVSSGYSEAETITCLRGQRVSGFIQKPYTASWLVEQVKASIQVTAS
jgi:CheY-like chemotaxis protein